MQPLLTHPLHWQLAFRLGENVEVDKIKIGTLQSPVAHCVTLVLLLVWRSPFPFAARAIQ
jgi:hypothetical protein